MRMFTLVTLSDNEFVEFSARHPQGNFQQTASMARMRRSEGKTVELLGVKEQGELKAAALLQILHTSGSSFALVHDGPLCDYDDFELLSFFVKELKSHAKAHGAAQLDITPEQVYRLHTQEGEPTTPADDAMIKNLKTLGFEHMGFTIGYPAVPRWRWVKNLEGIQDEQSLLASYAKYRRRNVRIARESGVHTRRLGRDELHIFHELCEISCKKQGFPNRPLSFFEAMYDAYGDDIEYRLSEIHFDEYLATWQDKLDKLEATTANITKELAGKCSEKRAKQLNVQLEKASQDIAPVQRRVADAKALIERYGKVKPVEAAMFLYHPREVVCTTSGADGDFERFYAPALMHHEVMLTCIQRGIHRFNLYGVSGRFSKDDNPDYGVLEFKQRFNGFVEEMPGEFILPVKPLVYALKKFAHKLLKR
ncbi:aminoacyltransferase [Bifidobacterium oedipodis]|uniref:Peptidoglycan bridge formation protein FemAB n=1 Tax=Bifidobacterium oedipodis TaxID=2675322 RepID=A0A7Y0ERM5_9BIFI|nr:aminoacyltransferase [Bifidobacterium sp. DSM 109957]NMM95168.1 peptidoglycan bridge formation protein FemAB [Bifidobacterium sp. DSM 109957]